MTTVSLQLLDMLTDNLRSLFVIQVFPTQKITRDPIEKSSILLFLLFYILTEGEVTRTEFPCASSGGSGQPPGFKWWDPHDSCYQNGGAISSPDFCKENGSPCSFPTHEQPDILSKRTKNHLFCCGFLNYAVHCCHSPKMWGFRDSVLVSKNGTISLLHISPPIAFYFCAQFCC